LTIGENREYSQESGIFARIGNIRKNREPGLADAPLRIVTTAWNASTAVLPAAGQAVGGLETFAWSLARSLAARYGHQVTFCIRVRDRAAPARELASQAENVRLHVVHLPWQAIGAAVAKSVQRQPRFPWLSLRHWNPHLVWQLPVWLLYRSVNRPLDWTVITENVLRATECQVALAFGVNADSAAAVRAAGKLSIPAVVWLQSNCDLEPRFFQQADFRDRNGVTSAEARVCLEQATYVICQTDWQARQLQAVSNLPHCVIRNPVDPVRYPPGPEQRLARTHVLWIGRYDDFHKRPLLALQVAQACPEIPFLMVINPGDERIREEVLRLRPPNVTIQDYIPNDRMPQAFQQARCYLNTGSLEYEGFPNVLLESAAAGTPIVSLHDFDRFLQRSAAGSCADGDVQQLTRQLQEVWSHDQVWQTCSRAGIGYVRQQHSLATISSEVDELLQKLMAGKVR
jgi:glycosyltransferase involved in cell wall biosynthesis